MMMMNGTNDSLAFEDEDRLPWLEPAYDEDDDEEVSLLRLAIFIIAGLAVIGAIVGGVYLIRSTISSESDPRIIAAPAGPYKVRATDTDAKKFEGEGDASFAASEGIDRDGTIDPSRLPETPVTAAGRGVVSAPGEDSGSSAAAAVSRVKTPVADNRNDTADRRPAWPTARAEGPVIQLGAYGSAALARSSWLRLSKRFDYLASLSHSIEPVTVGGTKFYRLRAAAGKDASTLCGRLKVAGENCLVVN